MQKIASMVDSEPAYSLANAHKLQLLNVLWEDTEGSSSVHGTPLQPSLVEASTALFAECQFSAAAGRTLPHIEGNIGTFVGGLDGTHVAVEPQRMRHVALLATTAILFATTACTMTRQDRGTLAAVGGASLVVGALMVAAGPTAVDSDSDGANEWALNDDYTTPAVGTVLLLAGIGLLVGAATARELEDVHVDRPTASAPGFAPGFAPAPTPGFVPAPDSAQASGNARPEAAAVRASMPALPEVVVDAETLRLAQQTRMVVAAGHCQAARPLLDGIAARSPQYHRALVSGPVLDRCPALR